MDTNRLFPFLSEMAIFVNVGDSGSFSNTDKKLGVSPSSVSRSINRLENVLEQKLLGRTTRQMRLSSTGQDLGVLPEYNKDTQEFMAPPLDDDVFVGAQLTFNDIQSKEFLIGSSQDLNRSNSRLIFVEGNRRIGESWTLTVDARTFSSTDATDLVFVIREDDYASLTMEYYY